MTLINFTSFRNFQMAIAIKEDSSYDIILMLRLLPLLIACSIGRRAKSILQPMSKHANDE